MYDARNRNAHASFGAHQHGVVLVVDAGLEVHDAIGPSDDRVEHPRRAADDEVRAEVVHAVGAQHDVFGSIALDAEVQLLHDRVLHAVVDDVDARRAGARKDEAGERVGQSTARTAGTAGRGIEEEHVARAHLDRQRATVEPALERLDLERDPVVVDAVPAVHARPRVARRPVEADARPEVVAVGIARALQERLHDRIDLVHSG